MSQSAYVGLDRVIDRLKEKDSKGLANHAGKFLLIRRFVSGDTNARGGNIQAELPLPTVGKGLRIRYGKQQIEDFAIDPVFANMDLSTIVILRSNICGGSESCNSFPKGHVLDHFLADLIKCNGGEKGVFEFDDAFVVLDMTIEQNLAIGEGVVIQKERGELQPKILLISQ